MLCKVPVDESQGAKPQHFNTAVSVCRVARALRIWKKRVSETLCAPFCIKHILPRQRMKLAPSHKFSRDICSTMGRCNEGTVLLTRNKSNIPCEFKFHCLLNVHDTELFSRLAFRRSTFLTAIRNFAKKRKKRKKKPSDTLNVTRKCNIRYATIETLQTFLYYGRLCSNVMAL